MPRHIPIIGPEPYSPEWYALRVLDEKRDPIVCFGASEAAALCGISDHCTTYELYLRKLGLIPEIEDNEDMQFGRAMEGVILSEYSRRTGKTLRPCRMLHHPEYPFITATPDAMAFELSPADEHPIDAKNTNVLRFAKEFGEEYTDEVPTDILMQAQQQMLVSGTDIQETPVVGGMNRLKVFRIERNETLCSAIIAAAKELHQRILDRKPPEPDFRHKTTLDLIKKAFSVNPGEVITLSEKANDLWCADAALGTRESEIKKERKALKAQLLYEMGTAGTGLFPSGDTKLVRQVRHRSAYSVGACSYTVLEEQKVK